MLGRCSRGPPRRPRPTPGPRLRRWSSPRQRHRLSRALWSSRAPRASRASRASRAFRASRALRSSRASRPSRAPRLRIPVQALISRMGSPLCNQCSPPRTLSSMQPKMGMRPGKMGLHIRLCHPRVSRNNRHRCACLSFLCCRQVCCAVDHQMQTKDAYFRSLLIASAFLQLVRPARSRSCTQIFFNQSFLLSEMSCLVQAPKADKGPAALTGSGDAGNDSAAAGAAQLQHAAAVVQ